MVIGHAPTKDGEVLLEHPHYGESVILIDTRISDERRGAMSAIAIEGETVTPIYVDDRDAGRVLESVEENALERSDRPAPADGETVFRRAMRWLSSRFG
jgi:hypothetical protein